MNRFLSVLAIILAACFFFLQFLHWNLEDGYIVYRVVRNILAGNGWAYNIGQSYNPSTSILNPILLSIFSFAVRDIPMAAHALCGIYLAVIGLGVTCLLEQKIGIALATAVALAGMYSLAWAPVWGLETMLLCAVLVVIAVLESRNRSPWIFYGLAILARPDAALLAIGRIALLIAKERRFPIRESFLISLPVIPWVVYSLATFGEVFPATLRNKMWQGRSGFWGNGYVFWQGFKEHLKAFVSIFPIAGFSVPRYLIVIVGLLGAALLTLQMNAFSLIVIFAVLNQMVYVLLNVPAYLWYFAPFNFAMVVCATYFLAQIIGLIEVSARFSKTISTALLLGLTFCVVWSLFNWRAKTVWASGNEHYIAAAQAINAVDNPPKGSLAAVEVGTLGYFVNREIFDFIGLTSPNREVLSGAHVDEFFNNNPAFVILHEPPWAMEYAIASDPRFALTYGDGSAVAKAYLPLKLYTRALEKAPSKADADRDIATLFPPIVKLEPSEEIMERGIAVKKGNRAQCVVDTINGGIWTGTPAITVAASVVRLSGWIDVPEQEAKLELKKRNSKDVFLIDLKRGGRPDVAAHLKREDGATMFGFNGAFAKSAIGAGRYKVSILIMGRAGAETLCYPGLDLELQ